jgi:hypothetical protein
MIQSVNYEGTVDHPYSAVGLATGYGLDCRGFGVRIPVGANFSPLHIIQTGSRVHPAPYSMGTGGSFTWDKEAGA